MFQKCLRISCLLTLTMFAVGTAVAQTDPGAQSAPRITATNLQLSQEAADAAVQRFFNDGKQRFSNAEVVTNQTNTNVGLGPRFNNVSCVSCHAQPIIGGSGPAANSQFGIAGSSTSPNDNVPYFVTPNGPTVEARFPFFFNQNGTVNLNAPNGGVEDLFTVTGNSGAPNCNLQQPSFNAARAAGNIIFRIPTPVFGAGLLENLDDSTLLINQQHNLSNSFGISGAFNHNGNDGTISRFGWKAQNKSLHIFSGEAYNVEMGISNLLFGQDRPLPGEDQLGTGLPAGCLNLGKIGYPEDNSNPSQADVGILDDVSAFANFMRELAPPPVGPVVLNGVTVSSASLARGQALFSSIGCASCHNPTPGTTQPTSLTGSNPPATGAGSLGLAPVNAFSDIEIHHMGTGLADNVSQGGAGGDQFRTAPLWGLGQRIFLLHDGRTTDLNSAIQAHESNGSEANTVEDNFDNLSTGQKQDLLNFLRSL